MNEPKRLSFLEQLRSLRPDTPIQRRPFIPHLRELAARTANSPSDPWTPTLRQLRGRRGSDGVERIATDAILDALDLPRHQRTPEAAKRIKSIMVELGWTPVRATHVTARGRAARVRGYARIG